MPHYPTVGTPHPEARALPTRLLESIHARVEAATSREIADAVVRFLDNTARTTVRHRPDGSTYAMTGDIPAMWLRDSSAQVAPYLRLLGDEPALAGVVGGLLTTHWQRILIDPYANAFNEEPNGNKWDDDKPAQGPWVWERKFETDSLAYPLDLAARLNAAGDTSWISEDTVPAFELILDVLERETDHEARSEYFFIRENVPSQDTLGREGRGCLTVPCGLVWQGFRPSDDACELGFNIPGNLFLVQALRGMETLLPALEERGLDPERAQAIRARARALGEGIIAGVREHGVMEGADANQANGDPSTLSHLAYEVDGAGTQLFMDDANVPSLLSLPYLGVLDAADPLYRRTRAAVLSEKNPYYTAGSALSGVGSPHTPEGYVWPIALSIEALTAIEEDRPREILDLLLATTGGTGYMHEGVDANDPEKFTREWFSWSNAMFCEAALEVAGYARPTYAEPIAL